MRKYIGGFIVIIGLTGMLSIADGSAYNALISGIGIVLITAGALIGWYNPKKKKA